MAASREEMGRSSEDRSSQSEVLRERIAMIVSSLENEAERRVGKRDTVEKRWLEDLAQYHGKYSDKTTSDLKTKKKSQLFINQTRAKTNAMEARLNDMLFPTDDRNWGIKPTPVPDLAADAEQAAQDVAEAKEQAAENPEDQNLQAIAKTAEQKSKLIKARMDEARKRAKSMEDEIDDHLRECHYSLQARDVIQDGCKLGTGVMKGPVTGGRQRRAWQLIEKENSKQFELTEDDDLRPAYWRVDPWNFFPDSDAGSMKDCEGVYERHLMNPKQLRRLARRKGFNADAIRRLLEDRAHNTLPQYVQDLRSITGTYHDVTSDRYHVWEFHGALTADQLEALSMAFGKNEMMQDITDKHGEFDPLAEINVIIWFCQGELLKFGLHHLDSGEAVYSVFNLEKDEHGIFGFGVPFIMRDSQSSMNAAWRTMLDNAGLGSGPQIVIDARVIEPVDGEYTLQPRKVWLQKEDAPPNAKPFQTFDIPMYQAELAAIVTMSKQFMDEETSMPMLAQGEQGASVTKTAQGMSILMNSVNVVFRRIVKNWDDDMTTPNIGRIYDFLMQFSTKEHIKGDYQVDARGSSVLLVREIQSGNLLSFLLHFGSHPTLEKYLKEGGLPAMRRLAQTMMIPAEELIKTDDEVREDEARAAENPVPNPEIMKLEMQGNIEQMKADSARELELLRRETAMIQYAAQANLKLEEVRAKLEDSRANRESKERQFAAEAAMTERHGPTGGGNF